MSLAPKVGAVLTAIAMVCGPESHAQRAANPVKDAQKTLQEARYALSASGLVTALEQLVALELEVGTSLTERVDFEIAASLVKDDPELVARLVALRPLRYRGATGGPKRIGFDLAQGDTWDIEIDFDLNDHAIAYVRSDNPELVRMRVFEVTGTADQTEISRVGKLPIFVWEPREVVSHIIRVEILRTEPMSLELITN